MSKHAFLSPSSGDRWMTCNASPHREHGLPDTESEAARIGTAAHELLERALKARGPKKLLGVAVGRVAKNGIVFTEEISENIDSVHNAILAEYPGVRWLIEKKVPIGDAFGCADELWGTADLIGGYGDRLVVADLKYGTHAVSPENNTQLLLYAIGAAHKTNWRHDFYDLVILQPRTGELFKRSSYTAKDLGWWQREFYPLVRNALSATAGTKAVPGNHCYFCKAANACAEKNAERVEKLFAEFL